MRLSEKFIRFKVNPKINFKQVKNILSVSLALILSMLMFGCNNNEIVDKSNEIVDYFKAEYAPDKRVALFDIEMESSGKNLVIKGETDQLDAYDEFLDSLNQYYKDLKIEDKVTRLPDAELGDKVYGAANNSVVNLRSRASHSAELSTQALLGMPLKVLKRRGEWFLVQAPDKYISWIDHGGIQLMNKEELDAWKESDKIIYMDTYGFSYEDADKKSSKIGDLTMGNTLSLLGSVNNFYKVEYPDGRQGYVAKSEAQLFDKWRSSVKMTQNSLVEVGKDLMGVPYLWGGTSTKGMDCSGFTKTIYLMNGEIIPRDASQQITAGELVDADKNFDNLEPGDLLFFGSEATEDRPRSVVHVGMWIGNGEFIHASSRVQINSMDPDADNFSEFNYNRYLESRRYISDKTNMLEVAEMFN